MNIELKIDPRLLHAFASIQDGEQFDPEELHCRLTNATTDEGYPVQNRLVLEFYGVPADTEWYKKATGRDSADIVFTSLDYNPAGDGLTHEEWAAVMIREVLKDHLDRKRTEVAYLEERFKGLISDE